MRQQQLNTLPASSRLAGSGQRVQLLFNLWTVLAHSPTFSYGNHDSTEFKARSTGIHRERAFAFRG
jgi:hypothetical protein